VTATIVEARPVSLPRVVLSELTKLRSVRSTAWALLTTAALIIGPGILICLAQAEQWPPDNPADAAGFDATAISLTGVYFATLAIGVLGILVVSGEYATGSIRSTFAAVPRRLPVLWGKVIAFGLAVPVVCVPAVLIAFLGGQKMLDTKGIGVTMGDPGVARAVLGSALFLTMLGMLGIGLGMLLRNTAAAVTVLVGMLLILPLTVSFLPASLSATVNKFLPLSAGTAITNVGPVDPAFTLTPLAGLGVFTIYVVVFLALGAVRVATRDV
jgi:ABC-2 type transport system permease protein